MSALETPGTDLVVSRLGAARMALREAKTIQDKHKLVNVSEALILFAKRQGASEEVKAEAASFHVDTMLLLGEALKAMEKAKGGQPYQSNPTNSKLESVGRISTLAELGIAPKTSMIAQKIFALSPEKQEALRDTTESLAVALREVEQHNHRAQGTGENEWYTPAEHIEVVRAFLGGIELDPASSAKAQKVVKAAKFHTRDDDGLAHEWNGRVWLNPPYAQPAIQQFTQKMVDEVRAGRVTEAIMLTHNYTDTAWFHIAQSACAAICFTRGRIAFIDPDGNKAMPTQGQAFFYYGDRVKDFVAAFSRFGFVVKSA